MARQHWRLLFVTAVAVLTALLLLPDESLPPVTVQDKLAHVLAFGVLAGLARRAWPQTSVPVLAIALTTYALATELLQIAVPGRTFSALDVTADTAGIVGYFAIAAVAGKGPVSGRTG